MTFVGDKIKSIDIKKKMIYFTKSTNHKHVKLVSIIVIKFYGTQ
jgi:hypothetical protein